MRTQSQAPIVGLRAPRWINLKEGLNTSFGLHPAGAYNYQRSKGLKATFDYRDMLGAEHDAAFTVAKMADLDLLADVHRATTDAIAKGTTKEAFIEQMTPLLQKAGWWGKKDVLDPLTGQTVKAQLGSAARLETIFRTNMQNAYAVGAWDGIQAAADEKPYLMYDAIDDFRTRPAHAELDNVVFPIGHPFWLTHYPPNGYNCRCTAIAMDAETVKALNLKIAKKWPAASKKKVPYTNPRTGVTTKIPSDLDPGWDHNPGIRRQQKLDALLREKIDGLPEDMRLNAHAARELNRLSDEQRAIRIQQAANEIAEEFDTPLDAAAAQKAAAKKAALAVADAAAEQSKANAKAQAKLDGLLAIAGTKDDSGNWIQKAHKKLSGQTTWKAADPSIQLDELLALANELKQKNILQGKISQYKKALVQGKTPPPAVAKAFESLSDTEKDAYLTKWDPEIQAAKAADLPEPAPVAVAQADLDAVATQGKAAAAKEATGTDMAVNQALGEMKANLLDGKPMGAKGKALIDELTEDEIDILTDVWKNNDTGLEQSVVGQIQDSYGQLFAPALKATKKPKPAPKPTPKPVPPPTSTQTSLSADVTGRLSQIGPQKGSNPGALYQDPETGAKWYIKTPRSQDAASNEVLAAKLYEAAGVNVADLTYLADFRGQGPSVASRIIDDLADARTQLAAGNVPGAQDAFAIDAWLSDWDVVGLSYDNMLVKGGQAFRIDVGGALRYRAQGGLKGDAFGDVVTEIDTMRDAALNPRAASVFQHTTDEQIRAGVRRIVAISDETIDRLVRDHGPTSAKERTALAARLKARREDLRARFLPEEDAAQGIGQVEPDAPILTTAERERVHQSGARGYGMRIDGGALEDHALNVHRERLNTTTTELVATGRIRGDLANKLTAEIDGGGEGHSWTAARFVELSEGMTQAIKGVRARAAKGEPFKAYDMERAKAALAIYEDLSKEGEGLVKAGRLPKADLNRFVSTFKLHRDGLRLVAELGDVNKKAEWNGPDQFVPGYVPDKVKAAAGGAEGRAWKPVTEYRETKIVDGEVRQQKTMVQAPGTFYETEINGVTVRFMPNGDPGLRLQERPTSLRGTFHIRTADNDQAGARIQAALDELGVPTARTTAGDAEEAYLRKILYQSVGAYNGKQLRYVEAINEIEGLEDQSDRITTLAAAVEDVTGKDVRQMPGYNPEGRTNMLGDGGPIFERPDLDGPAWRKFEKNYRIFTDPTYGGGGMKTKLKQILDSGGNFLGKADLIQRGVEWDFGASARTDLTYGGGQWVYTRLKPIKNTNSTGVYWKPTHLRRLDSLAYKGDKFGQTAATQTGRGEGIVAAGGEQAFVLGNRNAGDVSSYAKLAEGGHNEVMFKGALSIFDELDKIVVKAPEVQGIVQLIRDKLGSDTMPDGRLIKDVVQASK